MGDINKLLGYTIARFGTSEIPVKQYNNREVYKWFLKVCDYFCMNTDCEEIESIHNNYKNYTATQMREHLGNL